MIISAVVAVDNKGVIGRAGEIPWYLPADLAHFKQVTMGHAMIMGRKTYETIGRALPGRQTIVLSHNPGFRAEGCLVVDSLDAALKIAQPQGEVMIIGGQQIFELAMPRIERIYLTKIDADKTGDKFFKYKAAEWRISSSQQHSQQPPNNYDYEFITLERII